MNSLPETVIRQRRGCDLNPGPSAPESSTLTTRLPSYPSYQSLRVAGLNRYKYALCSKKEGTVPMAVIPSHFD